MSDGSFNGRRGKIPPFWPDDSHGCSKLASCGRILFDSRTDSDFRETQAEAGFRRARANLQIGLDANANANAKTKGSAAQ